MPLYTPGILGLDLLSQAAARRPLAVSALVVRCQRAGGLDPPVAPSTVEALLDESQEWLGQCAEAGADPSPAEIEAAFAWLRTRTPVATVVDTVPQSPSQS